MIKIVKKVLLSSMSILVISVLIWIVFILNPSLSYANKTHFEFVTVYHNQPLEAETETILKSALEVIKQSELFNDKIKIELCLNDDKLYRNIHPLVGDPLAFAVLDKTIIKNCTINFKENRVDASWEINNFEHRRYSLIWLLSHEFMHNLQNQRNLSYVIKSTMGTPNWKLEGHAEYISRNYKNDGLLMDKIKNFENEITKKHTGLPVIDLEDGTKQILNYHQYALVIQYLMEVKKMNYEQVCDLDHSFDELYTEMIQWSTL